MKFNAKYSLGSVTNYGIVVAIKQRKGLLGSVVEYSINGQWLADRHVIGEKSKVTIEHKFKLGESIKPQFQNKGTVIEIISATKGISYTVDINGHKIEYAEANLVK